MDIALEIRISIAYRVYRNCKKWLFLSFLLSNVKDMELGFSQWLSSHTHTHTQLTLRCSRSGGKSRWIHNIFSSTNKRVSRECVCRVCVYVLLLVLLDGRLTSYRQHVCHREWMQQFCCCYRNENDSVPRWICRIFNLEFIYIRVLCACFRVISSIFRFILGTNRNGRTANTRTPSLNQICSILLLL